MSTSTTGSIGSMPQLCGLWARRRRGLSAAVPQPAFTFPASVGTVQGDSEKGWAGRLTDEGVDRSHTDYERLLPTEARDLPVHANRAHRKDHQAQEPQATPRHSRPTRATHGVARRSAGTGATPRRLHPEPAGPTPRGPHAGPPLSHGPINSGLFHLS